MANTFSEKSRERLDSCHPDLVEVCELVLEVYDFTVLEGHRSVERQEKLFTEGKSKLRGGESKHNSYPSLAVDIAPYPIDWHDNSRFYLLAGLMFATAHSLGVTLRWGGDWDGDWEHNDQTFIDLPHFEVIL